MPFTVNVGPYQGGNFLASGLANLGEGIGKGIDKWEEAKKNEAADNIIIDYALKSNLITPEQHTEFINGNRTRKDGIVAGLVRQFTLDTQRQQMEALKEQRAAQADLRSQQAAAFNWTPSEADRATARAAGGELVPTGPGKFSFAPYSDTTGAAGVPTARALKTDTGEDTGLLGITLPGSKNLQVVAAPDSGIEYDEDTGLYGTRGKTGFKPLDPQSQLIAQSQRLKAQKAQQPAAAGGQSTIDRIWNSIFGQPATTPTPAPAAPAAQAAAVPVAGGKVKVKAPNGQIGLIPAAQLDAALAQGYTQVQ